MSGGPAIVNVIFFERSEPNAENQIPEFYFYPAHGVLHGLRYDLLCNCEKYGRAVLCRVSDCTQRDVD